MKRNFLLTLTLILAICFQAPAQTGVKKRRPLPPEYGRVILGQNVDRPEQAPVVFEHWIHRSMFTCRVCHVDIGFAMKTNASGIKPADIQRGYYCGSCHNARMMHGDRPVFAGCGPRNTAEDQKRCERCHSYGKVVRSEYDFTRFSANLPKERFGNGIDWEKSEQLGLIKPADLVEGISIKRNSLAVQKDFALNPKLEGMPDIIFSHKKHTVWNGCELCHPEIFFGVKKGATKYTMVDIFEGKSCGACHSTVAFPAMDCQRCHSKPVQQ
jgi:c(7)-type cytochrome triheme protein